MQDWLYEEGEDEIKSTYVAKLNELRQTGQPLDIVLRPTVRRNVGTSLSDRPAMQAAGAFSEDFSTSSTYAQPTLPSRIGDVWCLFAHLQGAVSIVVLRYSSFEPWNSRPFCCLSSIMKL